MLNMSVTRMGGLALIIGPVLAFVMFLLQPGGLLVEPADSSDVAANIAALTGNAGWSGVTSIFVCLGLILNLLGLYALQTTVRGGAGDGLTRAGLAFIAVGTLSWIWAQGANLGVALDLGGQEAHFLTPLYAGQIGATIIGGASVALGVLCYALGLPASGTVGQWANRLVALVSVVSIAFFSWAISDLDTGLTVARSLYIIWVVWLVYLGVRLMKQDGASGG